MKRVYSAIDPVMPGMLKEILEGRGIPCVLKNEHLAGAAGQIPVNETWPELWVMDDRDYELAVQLVRDALVQPGVEAGASWRCPRCGEQIEGQFRQCWHCGQLRPGSQGGTAS